MILNIKSYFFQIYKIIFLLLLTNISNLYAHNLVNGGCKNHCGQKVKAINNEKKLKNLRYICTDIRKIETNNFLIKKKISLLVSNSLIHHITNLEDFFNTIRNLSSNVTVNFHKDLKRPLDEKSALELKEQCSKKYNEILTNDYYASLRASYTFKELKNFTLENDLSS